MTTNNEKIRILGKGITALALKDKFPNATLYDDNDFNEYDLNSNEFTVVSPGIPPYNDPEITEFDLNTKHAKYSFDIYVDKHADEETYPGLAAATERLKETYKDKDKLKKAAKDALSDIFDAYEDHIFKLFKDDSEDRYWNSRIDSHDDY